ncbi:tRNA pseudouridine(13) synthase TruD [Thalassomonas viridans]|uniref:tRNA pseudouridine synthase D n=1 Tax=Thalassomonas viridans TaxID=137584 RepID=A0AAE9Z780_9GAMM|nr:tRNA pseudouridine(13) synthase TruD [Thalassomonas viridans]WDE06392.1 tRNA pseudouridine(13) synthase TruD [Thalassomonas viridans]
MTTDFVSPLAYFHGKPESSGELRSQMSDFKVFEQLPFAPCGEGEHLLIHIRKTGANTVYVARQLAKYFKVKEALVSYAGLKDRFAVTEQWFGVHVPGKQVYDLSDLTIDGVEVLAYARHNKKLKTGALTGNRFEITLRNVTHIDALKQRWQQIVEHGVPNYFGEQRFGIEGGNIDKARELFAGTKVKDKKKRGIYLSAARSYLFNHVVSQRIQNNTFDVLAPGDVCMLAGSQSVFLAEEIDETLKGRLTEKDIDITAPMWGAGELKTTGEVMAFEQEMMAQHQDLCQGLPKFGLKQERRRIRLNVAGTSISTDQDSVTLTFSLPAGSYATTILRELIDYTDLTERAVAQGSGQQAPENKAVAG